MKTIVLASSTPSESFKRLKVGDACIDQHIMRIVVDSDTKQLVCEKCGYYFTVNNHIM